MTETLVCEFTVFGHAEPSGSKQSFVPLHPKTKQPYRRPNGGIVVSTVDDNTKAKAWKKAVGEAARAVYIKSLGHVWRAPYELPVMVEFTFYKVRPRNQFRTGRYSHLLRPDAPAYPATKPDLLKLSRSVEDAMIGIVYKDDCQIVKEHLSKVWGDTEQCEIKVWSISP